MSKKQLFIELLMPVIFMAVSLYFIMDSIPMGSEGIFPLMCGVLQLLCAAYLLVKKLIRQDVEVRLEGLHAGKVVITLLVLIAYVLMLDKAGYCIATFALVAFMMRFLGYKNHKAILLCSAATAAATYTIFGVLLSVPLPMLFFE